MIPRLIVRLWRLLPALLLPALLLGCSLFGSTPRVIPPLKDQAGLRLINPRWHLDLSDGSPVPLFPAVDDGHVFAARRSGDVESLDAALGTAQWKVSVNAALTGGVGAGDHLVVVGTRDGEVVALDQASGAVRWRVASGGGAIAASAVISDGVVVVRTGDGKIIGLAAIDGTRRWLLERGLPPLTLYRASGAHATRGALFLSMPGGKLLAATLDQGKIGWESTVSIPRGATELERVADVTAAPVTGDRDVCAASYQGRVGCFDAGNGNPLWSRETSTISGLGADASRVFVADEKGAVTAWERSSGTQIWKSDSFTGRRLVGALAAGGMVVTGDLQGYVHWLDRGDGKVLARGATDGSSLNLHPLFLGDGVLIQTRAGGLYAFPMP